MRSKLENAETSAKCYIPSSLVRRQKYDCLIILLFRRTEPLCRPCVVTIPTCHSAKRLRGGKKLKFLIMANGDYGDLQWYRQFKGNFDQIMCIDGGTARARQLGLVPIGSWRYGLNFPESMDYATLLGHSLPWCHVRRIIPIPNWDWS